MNNDQIGSVLYSWEAPEFIVSQEGGGRGVNIAMAIVLLGLLAWAIWARQWVAAALVGMGGLAIYLLRTSQPRVFTHSLTDAGVLVGKKFYPYGKLRSFWLVLDGNVRVLNLLPSRKFGLALTLQLGDASIDKVRDALSGKLPEDASRGEDPIDKVGRMLKF